ncbi:hypothetical protein QE152_g33395 [Popillia japonica]|uniref:EGF-like domain-containing protein n=1 Tax=Popillia japonica TaxID=7064 RepID=A0AAW1IWY3_POPJA
MDITKWMENVGQNRADLVNMVFAMKMVSANVISGIGVTAAIKEEEKIRYVSKCCNGYYEVDGKCWSESCRSCEYGVCNEDGICQCNFGYWGDSCDKGNVNTYEITQK